MIGTVFIVAGLIFVPVGICKIRTNRASRSWPQTTATGFGSLVIWVGRSAS